MEKMVLGNICDLGKIGVILKIYLMICGLLVSRPMCYSVVAIWLLSVVVIMVSHCIVIINYTEQYGYIIISWW